MSRRRRESLSPTLFPFLAVLVCTLGTLILLLALVAQNTTEAAQELAELPPDDLMMAPEDGPPTVHEVQQLVEEEEFRLEELVSFREAQTGDLEQRRDQLAHIEDHTRRIREQLDAIGESMRAALDESPIESVTDDDIQKLKSELEEKDEHIKKLRETSRSETPRVVIVPHQGPNGTTRRPIYLECDDKGVTIWPEGVKITLQQLLDTQRGANPLDDGLRAARYYVQQNSNDPTPPYPMLVVRPNGVESYYAARAAMLDWDDQFGYELVPSQVELAYHEPDPTLHDRVDYAVKEAVKRQTQFSIARTMSRPGGSASGGRSPYGTARGSGTPSNRGKASSRPLPPRLSATQMDLRGRRSGFRDHRTLPRTGYGNSGGGLSDQISPEAAKRRLEQRMQASAGELARNGSAGMDPFADSSYSGSPSSGSQPSGSQALDQIGSRLGGGRSGSGSRSFDLPTGEQSARFNGDRSELASQNESGQPITGQPSAGQPSAGQQQGTGREQGSPSYSQLNDSDINPYKNAASEASDASQQEGGQSGPSEYAASQSTNSNPGDASRSAAGQSAASQSANSQSPETDRQDQSFAAGSSASQPARPSDAMAASMSAQQGEGPSQQANSPGRPQPSQARRAVRRDGVDWALPSAVAQARGNDVVRSIRVAVYGDGFVLLPGAGTRVQEVFPIRDGDVNQTTLELAAAIRERIEKWGAALPGGRWAPRLRAEVMPGGEYRYDQLQRLMTGSGLEIEASRAQAQSTQGQKR